MHVVFGKADHMHAEPMILLCTGCVAYLDTYLKVT